jgi:conjugative relaxase-like TrwC/TraI family protein
MLSLAKMGAGQEGYYLGEVAEGAEDYYSGQGEAEGYWLGDAAEDLGLQGKVDPDQLVGMLTGTNPASGEPFGLQHVSGRGPVPGFDLTFGAPKSVSVIWALGGRGAAAEVKAAHAAAVQAGLDYLQGAACWTRRGKGGREFLKGNGLLGAGYVHRSSRAGDPHLHTHVLVANATFAEGRWTRLYHPALYEHAKTASAIYEAHLRDELTRRLGVRFKEVRNGIAEIQGFDPDHLRHFSKRRVEILEAAGPDASAEALQVATLATRPQKEAEAEGKTMRDRWRREAEEIGLDREAIRSTFDRSPEVFDGRLAVAEVEARVTEFASHFDRRDVIQAVGNALRSGAPGSDVEELADSFLSIADLVRIAESPKGERFTTRAIWELERKALGTVSEMAGSEDRAVVSEIVVGRVIAERPSLKPDQRAMVERLLTGGEGVVVVIGEAGTGKTYALSAAARGWESQEIPSRLRAAAPTWRAANVLRAEGFDATSVARLLGELDGAAASGEGGLGRGSVLLVDEAGMVDSRNLARLIDHAREAEAKLVLIGDPAQLGEIEAGGLFAAIGSRTDPVVLDEVIRHRQEAEREGAKLIREGEGREALAVFEGAERVTVAADPAARREAMVGDWLASFERGDDALMIAKTNREVAALNARAREELKAGGHLGAEEIEVGGQSFAVGDQIVTRINDQAAGIHNRERWRVAEVEAGSGRMWLDGIDTRLRVCADAVYLERVRERDGGPAIEHAYAANTYQAQGSTVDRAFVAADPSMNQQDLYVALSRSREETNIYAIPEFQRFERDEFAPADPYMRDGLEHIAEAAERDGAQVAAFDVALRERFAQLPTGELAEVVRELRAEAGAEAQNHQRHERIQAGMQRESEGLEEARARMGDDPIFKQREISTRERIERSREEQAGLAEVAHDARAELAAARHVQAQREQAAATAARVSPPDYVTAELGERPADLQQGAHWDKTVGGIERYRVRNGVLDKDTALGPKQTEPDRQHEQQRAREAIERAQRQLQLRHQQERAAERGIERGIGL